MLPPMGLATPRRCIIPATTPNRPIRSGSPETTSLRLQDIMQRLTDAARQRGSHKATQTTLVPFTTSNTHSRLVDLVPGACARMFQQPWRRAWLKPQSSQCSTPAGGPTQRKRNLPAKTNSSYINARISFTNRRHQPASPFRPVIWPPGSGLGRWRRTPRRHATGPVGLTAVHETKSGNPVRVQEPTPFRPSITECRPGPAAPAHTLLSRRRWQSRTARSGSSQLSGLK